MAGVGHVERIEDALFQEDVERFAGSDLDDAAKRVETIGGAVHPTRAGLEFERGLGQARDKVGERFFGLAAKGRDGVLPHGAGDKAGGVSEKLFYRKLAVGGDRVVFGRRGARDPGHRATGESRPSCS